MKKIIRVTTVPMSLGGLLKGQLRFMSKHFKVVGISSEGNVEGDTEALNNVGLEEGIDVIGVMMTRKITPIQDLKSVYKLYKIFKREKPLIVHSHTPKAGTVSMLAAKLAGVPNRLHTIAGLPLLVAKGPKRILLNVVEKFTYACATKIYPNSFGLKEIILENKFTIISKLKVIGNGSSNGIDTSFFNPELYSQEQSSDLRKELNLNTSDIVFVFVGRIVKDKGINELIEAFSKICVEYTNAKLLLVGSYERDLDPISVEAENEINSNENILSVGWQKDVRPYFAMANILVFPSYREGFPNVVMQAGAMNLPSIVTNINGCNEIIVNGENGYIIPVENSEELYERMKRFLDNQSLLQTMSLTARSTICKSYQREFVWESLLKEYNMLLEN